MNTLELDFTLTTREDSQLPDGVAAQIEGRAVPYGISTKIGGLAESFGPEAFDAASVIGKPLAWRHDEPVGVITGAENRSDGLYVTANILDTTQGRDAAILARHKSVQGLSVGFEPLDSIWNRAKDAVKHTSARLFELSLTPYPAYADAGISAVREDDPTQEGETPMTETVETATTEVVDAEAREAVGQVREQLAAIEARAFSGEEIHPLSKYRSFGEYVKAHFTGAEERALDVSTLADAPGLVPPVWFRDVKGVLDRGRPCINALGGPVSAAGAGLTINWPYFDGDLAAIVAAQANEGDEVNSVDIDIKKGTATLATYGAGNRLSYQVIERTDPSYVDSYMRILMGAFGTETDYVFQNGLWANDTYGGIDYDFSADTTGSAFVEAVWNAAVVCQTATGQPAEVVYVNSAVYKKLGAWSAFQAQNYPVQNVGGTIDGRTGRATVMGLPIVLASEFATDETEDAIVTNRAAVAWAEDGPRTASNDVAGNLSRDYAIYGYGVITPFVSGGIVSIYNHA